MSDSDLESVQSCNDSRSPEQYSRQARHKARHMTCSQLADKIQELTDREKSGRVGTKGLIQRFRDYKGDDATHGTAICNQQRSLRTYIDEFISRGCGDPPSTSVEVAERSLPSRKSQTAEDSTSNLAKPTAIAGGVIVGGYLAYRVIRMLPSLLPPLWPSIPANLAVP